MYTIDWDGVNTHSGDKVIPSVVDQYFKKNALMYMLRPRAKIYSGGRSIVQPLSFAPEGGGGQWWSGTDRADLRIRQPFTAAQYWAKNFELPIVISQDEEDIVTGEEALMDLLESKMKVAQRTLMDSLGGANGIYNDGSNPKAITGLQYSLKDPAGANTTPPTMQYAGINCSSTLNTWWNHQVDGRAYVTGLGGSYIYETVFGVWDKMFAAQALASGKSSDLILINYGVWNEISFLVNTKTTWFRPQQDSGMHEAGFDNLLYRRKRIVVDEQVPRNATTKVEHVYMIDLDAMDLWVHTNRNFSFRGFREGFDQFIRAAFLMFRGELTFNERRSSGVYSNVDTTSTGP